ncbi:MAG: hypothetical protein C6Y22_17505 [Hapalosiphonaceae cyanobacterium JJU2]|nr:MAG: hypothetical protein C6Y22_17505 [Hapalosiphonaceae cyanobacterium JJU2]
MLIPPEPSWTRIPNTVNELLKGYRTYQKSMKKGLSDVKGITKQVQKENIENAKLAKDLKQAQDRMLSKVPGKSLMQKANNVAQQWGSVFVIGGIMVIWYAQQELQKTINNSLLDGQEILGRDLSDAFQRTINNSLAIRGLNQRVEDAKKQANDALYEVRQGRTKLQAQIDATNKKNNDILYEVREGRKIIEAKIADARKLGNDALYEIRQLKIKVEKQIADTIYQLNSSIRKQVSDALKLQPIAKDLSTTVSDLQKQVNTTVVEVNKQQQQVKAVEATTKNIQGGLDSLKAKDLEIQKNHEIFKVNVYREFDDQKILLDTKIAKVGDTITTVTSRMGKLESTTQNTQQQQSVQIDKINIKVDELEKDLKKQSKIADPAVPIAIQEAKDAKAKAEQIEKDIGSIKTDINTNKTDLQKISTDFDKRLKEQEKVNKEAIPKLDNIIGVLGLIPGRVRDTIKPDIPTVPDIERAVGTGICQSTNGGCLGNSLNNTANGINSNTNRNANNILDGYNAIANTGQMALLRQIDNKLGPQVDGGLSSKLERLAKWLHLDRVLNILIWWQTLHNAAMLSNNIVQTLASAFNNVLAFLGIKDAEGNSIDVGQILGQTYTNAIKAALGEDTYNNLNKAWNAASRIYQSAANIAFAIQSIQQSILNALEVVGAGVSKIANGLKAAGQVFDRAYEWMNPNPNFDNALFRKLENIQQVASNIEVVSQTPLDVQSAVNTMKEERNNMKEALKDGEDALQGLGIIESENQKKAADKRKENSAGQDLKNADKLEADD